MRIVIEVNLDNDAYKTSGHHGSSEPNWKAAACLEQDIARALYAVLPSPPCDPSDTATIIDFDGNTTGSVVVEER